jgi:hypothetical protein
MQEIAPGVVTDIDGADGSWGERVYCCLRDDSSGVFRQSRFRLHDVPPLENKVLDSLIGTPFGYALGQVRGAGKMIV